MKKIILLLFVVLIFSCKTTGIKASIPEKTNATSTLTSSKYSISFKNAVHHEAKVNATFSNLKTSDLEFRMSRTSPGRYALHEFMKNVYAVKVTDSKGNELTTTRPDPYSWKVSDHDGTVKLSYILFANRGGGTYTQIDETHAHLNIPATFIYVPSLANDGIEVNFNIREDLNWKIATQLKPIGANTYYAKNLQYFMDSPTEISNHSVRSFNVKGQSINFVLHHNGTDAELDEYFEKVKKVVLEQEAIYGELPKYDYGSYSFLACYIPNASGDGMEHRNSTILTSTRSLANGGLKRNLGTVSHEFFHCWNVERIRPKSLEPFNFEEANMSGELWFAEGFTSYYDDLTICRAGLTSQEDYITSLAGTFNYVWNSPGRQFFNPIEMSYQAPFVDAARSVDPVNRNNTFISYYSYGSALALALDLSLREKGLNLDNYMKLVWNTYGKNETPYTVSDLHNTLNTYAEKEFGDEFFNNYIYKSGMPNMKHLFSTVGVSLEQPKNRVRFGAFVRDGKITNNASIGSSAYNAGLENGDKIISIGDYPINSGTNLNTILSNFKAGDSAHVVFERFGNKEETKITFLPDNYYIISLNKNAKANKNTKRNDWLGSKL